MDHIPPHQQSQQASLGPHHNHFSAQFRNRLKKYSREGSGATQGVYLETRKKIRIWLQNETKGGIHATYSIAIRSAFLASRPQPTNIITGSHLILLRKPRTEHKTLEFFSSNDGVQYFTNLIELRIHHVRVEASQSLLSPRRARLVNHSTSLAEGRRPT